MIQAHYRLRLLAGTMPKAYEFVVSVPDSGPIVSTHYRPEIMEWIEQLESDKDEVKLGKTRLQGKNPQRARLAEYLELVIE